MATSGTSHGKWLGLGLVGVVVLSGLLMGLVDEVDGGSDARARLPEIDESEPADAPIFLPPPRLTREQWKMPGLWRDDPPFPFLPGEDRSASRSIDGVVHGHLVNSVQIPQPHPALTFLDVQYQRRLFFTTDRMRDLVVQAAQHVQKHYPGAVLTLGNFGNPGGGDIPYSVSHNSGRDADLGFYLVDDEGEPAIPSDLVALDAEGEYEGERTTYHFEPKRNWRLIEGLIASGGDQLQYIFVSRPLKRMLLTAARELGAEPAVRRRAEQLLHQPYGSLPHNDHFHIRIYCSGIDVASGCWDRGEKHAWYQSHDDRRRASVRRAKEALAAESADVRASGARRLAMLEAREATRELRELLGDPSVKVRAAVIRTLGQFGNSTRQIVEQMEAEAGPRVYLESLDALSRADGRLALEALTEQLGVEREVALSEDFRIDRRTFVAEALIRQEAAYPVEALIGLLDGDKPAVRVAAARALNYLTNHRFGDEWESPSDDVLRVQVDAWKQWFEENGEKRRDIWLSRGFKQAGYDVDRISARDVWPMTRAITDEDYLSHNAQRILMEISGRQPRSLAWPKEDASFYWRRWFERRWRRFGAPPVPKELSTRR